MAAPVTAILGYDTKFYDWLPRLFPHTDARSWFVDKPDFAATTAFRNSSLQGGYFIIAARALGLDCGPMSGFDNEAVDREFFPGGQVRSNFICALGYGDPARLICSLASSGFQRGVLDCLIPTTLWRFFPSLTPGNVGGSYTPGNRVAETLLADWARSPRHAIDPQAEHLRHYACRSI